MGFVGIHDATLEQSGFAEVTRPAGFGPLWKSYASRSGFARGYYHLCAPSDRFAYYVNAGILHVPLSELTTQHLIYFDNAACIYSQCLYFAFAPANYFAQTTNTTRRRLRKPPIG